MNTVQQTKQGGFTIIEVVLVLAIAGLIFLMVFIALPALQRNQRDTQRRDDGSRVISQLQSYATNNRGALPTTGSGSDRSFDAFLTTYLTGDFNDPSTGERYGSTQDDPGTGEFQYRQGHECNGESIQPVSGGSNRQGAVRIQLESGGFFCQSVQG